MGTKEKSFFDSAINCFTKLMLAVGIVIAFYKLPGIIAEKIRDMQI